MNTQKNTPGPWTIDEKLEGQTCITSKQHVSFAEPIICRVSDSSHVPLSEQDANAHLIAAAPDMLQALLVLRSYFEGKEHIPNALAPAIAAIAKATGTNA
jgi:hypothetical protein